MENFFSRYRNETVLVAILFIQVIGLATQVRVPNTTSDGTPVAPSGTTRLIRVWAVGLVSPFQRLYVHTGLGSRSLWHSYIDLRGVRQQNANLQQELYRMRMEQTRIQEDAEQGRRLQTLLGFKEEFIGRTLAAQVIGTSGTELSRVIYIDKGARDGVAAGMAVITPDGIVGKISRADRNTSQVLLITDPSSGAGVIVERLRLNGVLKGLASGYAEVENIMADEEIKPGDRVLTTGGDHVFPKGLPVGTVVNVSPDRDKDPFLAVKVKPAVNLGHLEEVLVVTELKERSPAAGEADALHPIRASDMLAGRLPTYKKKAEQDLLKAQKAQGQANPMAGEGPSLAPVMDPSSPPTQTPKQARPKPPEASLSGQNTTGQISPKQSAPNQTSTVKKAAPSVPPTSVPPKKPNDTLKEPPR